MCCIGVVVIPMSVVSVILESYVSDSITAEVVLWAKLKLSLSAGGITALTLSDAPTEAPGSQSLKEMIISSPHNPCRDQCV